MTLNDPSEPEKSIEEDYQAMLVKNATVRAFYHLFSTGYVSEMAMLKATVVALAKVCDRYAEKELQRFQEMDYFHVRDKE